MAQNPAALPTSNPRPGLLEAVIVYLFLVGVVARTLAWEGIQSIVGWYLLLELVYLAAFSIVLWKPGIPTRVLHIYFGFMTLLSLFLFALWPPFSFIVILFTPLCYEAGLVLRGRARPGWVIAISLVQGGSTLFFLGLGGLAEGLIPMAGGVIFAAYAIVRQEMSAARAQSQATLQAVQATNQQLQAYAAQAEELAALEERSRLSRELHDSVSQSLFSIILNTRATQLLLEREPGKVRAQLEQLRDLTQAALAEMRKFISELRPKANQ